MASLGLRGTMKCVFAGFSFLPFTPLAGLQNKTYVGCESEPGGVEWPNLSNKCPAPRFSTGIPSSDRCTPVYLRSV